MVAQGTGTLTYQFYRGTAPNGVVIDGQDGYFDPRGATKPSYATGPLGGATSYYAIVDKAYGPAKTSRTATMTFCLVVAGTAVELTHFDELTTAVNSVRAVAGAPALTWRQLLDTYAPATPAVEIPATGGLIRAAHVIALRAAMTDALQANSVPTAGYTDPALAEGNSIKAVHVTELQERAR